MNVASLLQYKDSIEKPVLVLVDLHTGILSSEEMACDNVTGMLENCRAVLAHARSLALPIAFMRQTAPAQSMLETRSCPAWIRGFEPRRSDMVFDRAMPSCYSNTEFAKMLERGSRSFVVAGLAAEMSCLSTVIEAYHRLHQATYLSDASSCGSKRYYSSADMRRGINAILTLYGAVSNTRDWIEVSSKVTAAGP
jgi:nicotinamidase-related amidase